MPKYAEGGYIPPVDPDRDSVPVWLSPAEPVVCKHCKGTGLRPITLFAAGAFVRTPARRICPKCAGIGVRPV